jgi:hypothetical protein
MEAGTTNFVGQIEEANGVELYLEAYQYTTVGYPLRFST